MYSVLATTPVSSFASVDFIADDGDANTSSGPSFDGTDYLWGSYFTASDPTAIDEVSVAFGRVDAGTAVTLLVYDDPDGDFDPRNATLVGSLSGVSGFSNAENPLPDTFTSYSFPIGGEPVVSGGFYVAAFISGVDGVTAAPTQTFGEAPARRDFQTATNQGFSFFGPEGESDLTDLSSFPVFQPVGDPTIFGSLAGNILVRARGTVIPEPTSLAMVSVGGLFLLRRRR